MYLTAFCCVDIYRILRYVFEQKCQSLQCRENQMRRNINEKVFQILVADDAGGGCDGVFGMFADIASTLPLPAMYE